MRASIITFFAALMFLITACAPKRFSEFTGRENWQVTEGAMAEHSYAVPVYKGWPDKPYRVLGSIRFANPRNEWKDGDTSHAARIAKSRGGDAIIMRFGDESGVGAIVGASGDPNIWISSHINALAIKWKTAAELAKEASEHKEFKAKFREKFPEISKKPEVLELAIEYLQWNGSALGSADFEEKCRELLFSLKPASSDRPTSQWLFKGTIRSGSLTSSSSFTVYGLASVNFKGGSASIITTEGKTSLNFSGTLQDGRLAGQMGFSFGATIVSARADGAALEDKLSLTSQSQTADGTFQGNFSFIH